MPRKTSPESLPPSYRVVHGHTVWGLGLDAQGRCSHYNAEVDVVALEMACCRKLYACIHCHEALADHPAQRWPRERLHEARVLCGACGTLHSAETYLAAASHCPACGAGWNPRCSLHHPLYYEMPS